MLRLFKQYYPIRNIFFVVGEGLIIFISILIAYWLKTSISYADFELIPLLKALAISVVCQICLYFFDLYDLAITDTFMELSIRLLQSLGVCALIFAGVYFFSPGMVLYQGVFTVSVFIIIIFIAFWRYLYMLVLSRGYFNQNVLLLGASELGSKIEKEIIARRDCGYSVAAKVMDEPGFGRGEKQTGVSWSLGGSIDALCEYAKAHKVEKIVVALAEKRGSLPVDALLRCRVEGIEVLDGIDFYEMLTGKLIVEQINPAWLVFSDGFKKSLARRFIKRAEDLILSSFLLVLLSPLIAFVAAIIKIDSKGPVIFSQDRVGENKRGYRIHKFRSMVADAEKYSGPVWANEADERITQVGKWLRKLRIDEIPQIWNVLKGEMSFVGPRPERAFFISQLENRIPYYDQRLSVKPGITGWAQILYGYGATIEDAVEKLNYDLFYIKNMSSFMDLMIVLRTVKTVLFGKGAR